MGTTLDNGIYLPDEGERNCYEGLAGNWVALDNHLGSTNIHVTINDKQAWNGHVADSVKHVTAEDKAKWDAVTSKADDSDVVHKSGGETVGGTKTFSDTIVLWGTTTPTVKTISNIIQDSTSGNEAISRVVRDKTDEHNVFSEAVNKFSGKRVDYRLDVTAINNGTELSVGVRLIADPINNTRSFVSSGNNTITLGDPGNKWRDVLTYKVNSVEPSSLSLPSGNANNVIDISSYLVNLDGTNNTYVAPANGWIGITMSGCSGVQAYITGLWGHQVIRPSAGGVRFLMPILKNQTATILVFGGTIEYARFIPCQGNV